MAQEASNPNQLFSLQKQKFNRVVYRSTPFQIPTRYVSQAMIGCGAYGKVVSVKCAGTGTHYAIKKLENIYRHPVYAKRAIREINILKQLKHDGILDIVDLYTDDTLTDLYIVSPLMDTDLHKVIRSSQSLLDKHVQFFVYQMLRSLLYMQSAGVIHRDIKPSNIFVDLNCDIKLGDLGMAKVIDFNPDSFVPMTEYVATRWYRAPEIMMWKAYGFEVDIWSIGCVMAELLTRRPLFPGQDLQDQIRRIISILGSPPSDFTSQIKNERIIKWLELQKVGKIPPLNQVIPGASFQALDLLSKMLKYTPHKRISVASALQHPYFSDFRDPSSERVTKNRVKFPHFVEKFNLEQLREAVMSEVAYYAKENNYIAEMVASKPVSAPASASFMPSIGNINIQNKNENEIMPMNVQQQLNSGASTLGMLHGKPVIFTPVRLAPVQQTTIPWRIDTGHAPKKAKKKSTDVRMENDKLLKKMFDI